MVTCFPMMNSLAAGLRPLIQALDALHIPYVVGGSLASSIRGIVRATVDIDLVVQISLTDCARLAQELGADWYADVPMMTEAIRMGRSFNLVWIPGGLKADIFPAINDFHTLQLRRGTLSDIPSGAPESVTCRVATAEDILLAKLRGYRDGGEVSDRQWSDITGILEVNSSLDDNYLEHWAARLGVSDLLARARGE